MAKRLAGEGERRGARAADVAARVVSSPTAAEDIFAHIDLDVTLKDYLYKAIGDAIKAGMHLREHS